MAREERRIRVVEVVGNGEGGGTKCVVRLVQHLDPAAYEMTVIAPDSPTLAKVCAERQARLIQLPLRQSRIQRATYRQLSATLAAVQPDIISVHGTRAAWYSLRALRSASIVPRPRVMYSEHLFSFDARRGIASLPWVGIERYICKHADALAVGCDANARVAESRGWIHAEQIAMRHYGVELEDFVAQARNRKSRAELGIPGDAPLIGTVGRLIPQKGICYLIEAIAKIRSHYQDVVLLIVGDGEIRESLEAQCRQLGISEHVRFLGEHPQPWRILANCDVIAFSSLFEGMQQTCLEALAIGMPVVATTMKGPLEYVQPGESGLLVPPRDANALAHGIDTLLASPELRQRLRERGPVAVQDYQTETMIAHFDQAYRSLYAQRMAGESSGITTTAPWR